MSDIHPRFRTIDGLSIRYAVSANSKPAALLLSPWPESLYAYDPTWTRLAEHASLIAVDLPGFGHSDLREDLLSPQAMGDFLVRIADAFDLDQPHVVGPDIGTSAALFAAAKAPERFRSIVIGSGGAVSPTELGTPLHEWVHDEDLSPYRALGPKDVVNVAMDAIQGYELPDVVRQDYLAGYQGQRFVEQMAYVRAYPAELRELSKLLPGITTPVQLINGKNDTVVPVSNAEYLHERLPNSRLDVVDAAHFVWEENADEYARIVTNWWQQH
ncbi:alpha/beta hydrolase [Lentzea sp. BCCO 10_0061]|uniref:Alpha/beta hydrolase n=1 Tax=Lentzea sokolovensis TaxID=3095429 RepID=A0ABU4VB00_9PSEU|nr:alpha/beta hydrolase [Lentzea sp. BCCO 10_0061]MDX8148959.1 alpha/beta hydrolase [Lentzea sp. BCCO 10_0061]